MRKNISSEGGDRGVGKNRHPVNERPTPNPSQEWKSYWRQEDYEAKKHPRRGRGQRGVEKPPSSNWNTHP